MATSAVAFGGIDCTFGTVCARGRASAPPNDKSTMSETPPTATQSKGGSARERLLALAEAAVLEKGFAATSIDELIASAGITKSGFFYHFKDKSELAKALMQRYIEVHDGI